MPPSCCPLALMPPGPEFQQQRLPLLLRYFGDLFRVKVELIAEGCLKPIRQRRLLSGLRGGPSGFIEATHLSNDVLERLELGVIAYPCDAGLEFLVGFAVRSDAHGLGGPQLAGKYGIPCMPGNPDMSHRDVMIVATTVWRSARQCCLKVPTILF